MCNIEIIIVLSPTDNGDWVKCLFLLTFVWLSQDLNVRPQERLYYRATQPWRNVWAMVRTVRVCTFMLATEVQIDATRTSQTSPWQPTHSFRSLCSDLAGRRPHPLHRVSVNVDTSSEHLCNGPTKHTRSSDMMDSNLICRPFPDCNSRQKCLIVSLFREHPCGVNWWCLLE